MVIEGSLIDFMPPFLLGRELGVNPGPELPDLRGGQSVRVELRHPLAGRHCVLVVRAADDGRLGDQAESGEARICLGNARRARGALAEHEGKSSIEADQRLHRREAPAKIDRRRPTRDETEIGDPHGYVCRRAIAARRRVDYDKAVACAAHRIQSLAEARGADVLESRTAFGLPGVGPVAQCSLAVEFQHERPNPALERGNFDIVLNGLELTAENQQRIAMSQPYFVYSQQIVTRLKTTGLERSTFASVTSGEL